MVEKGWRFKGRGAVRSVLGDAWSGVRGLVGGRSRAAAGYSQLPVEMSESV